MAIVSFTLLSIIGLMPSTLDELRQSERRAAEARILQSIAAEHELLPWIKLEQFTKSGPFFFDEAGLARSAQDQDTRYLANVEAPPLSVPLTLPGEGNASPYLKQLRVNITDRVNDPGALASDLSMGERREFYIIIAKQEADRGGDETL